MSVSYSQNTKDTFASQEEIGELQLYTIRTSGGLSPVKNSAGESTVEGSVDRSSNGSSGSIRQRHVPNILDQQPKGDCLFVKRRMSQDYGPEHSETERKDSLTEPLKKKQIRLKTINQQMNIESEAILEFQQKRTQSRQFPHECQCEARQEGPQTAQKEASSRKDVISLECLKRKSGSITESSILTDSNNLLTEELLLGRGNLNFEETITDFSSVENYTNVSDANVIMTQDHSQFRDKELSCFLKALSYINTVDFSYSSKLANALSEFEKRDVIDNTPRFFISGSQINLVDHSEGELNLHDKCIIGLPLMDIANYKPLSAFQKLNVQLKTVDSHQKLLAFDSDDGLGEIFEDLHSKWDDEVESIDFKQELELIDYYSIFTEDLIESRTLDPFAYLPVSRELVETDENVNVNDIEQSFDKHNYLEQKENYSSSSYSRGKQSKTHSGQNSYRGRYPQSYNNIPQDIHQLENYFVQPNSNVFPNEGEYAQEKNKRWSQRDQNKHHYYDEGISEVDSQYFEKMARPGPIRIPKQSAMQDFYQGYENPGKYQEYYGRYNPSSLQDHYQPNDYAFEHRESAPRYSDNGRHRRRDGTYPHPPKPSNSRYYYQEDSNY